jgi:DNA polymerase-3 subunit alpha
LFDIAGRLDARAINKRQIETMAHAGAFDSINQNRAQVFAAAETIVRYAAAASEERATGQVNLFGGGKTVLPPLRLPIAAAYDALEKLRKEFAAIGFYLSSHPLDAHEKPLKRLGVIPFASLATASGAGGSTRFRLAGVVVAKQERTSARGNRFAFLTLSDVSGIYDVTVFSELLSLHRDLMEAERTLVVTVDMQKTGDEMRLTAQAIEPLDKAIRNVATGLRIVLDEGADFAGIKALFQPEERSKAKILVSLRLPEDREATVELPPAWSLGSKNRAALETMKGVLEVEDL